MWQHGKVQTFPKATSHSTLTVFEPSDLSTQKSLSYELTKEIRATENIYTRGHSLQHYLQEPEMGNLHVQQHSRTNKAPRGGGRLQLLKY